MSDWLGMYWCAPATRRLAQLGWSILEVCGVGFNVKPCTCGERLNWSCISVLRAQVIVRVRLGTDCFKLINSFGKI